MGGLSWGVRDEALKEAFAVHGDVQEAIVILERGTNRSRGFGFVTFATEEEAQTAMEFMNGQEIDGRSVHVSIAEERRERPNNRISEEIVVETEITIEIKIVSKSNISI